MKSTIRTLCYLLGNKEEITELAKFDKCYLPLTTYLMLLQEDQEHERGGGGRNIGYKTNHSLL